MTEPQTKTFGEIAYKWLATEEKKSRIKQNVFSNTGICSVIFREYGILCSLQNHLLAYLAKHLSISGFRIQDKSFRKEMLPKLIKDLEKGNTKLEREFWIIYEIASVHYLKNKLPNLNNCLLNECPDEIPTTTVDFFRQLVLNTPKHDVKKEHILEFYEFWRFDFVENISEQIFTKELDSIRVTNKLISSLKAVEVDPLKESISEIKAELSEFQKKIDSIPNVEEVAEIVKNVSKSLEDTKIEIENRFSNLPAKLGSQVVNLSKSFEDLRSSVNKNSTIVNLQKKVEELEKRLDKFEKVIISESNQRVKVEAIPAPVLIVNQELPEKDEREFLQSLMYQIKQIETAGWVNEQMLIINHCFLCLTSPLVLKDSIIFEEWISLHPTFQKTKVYPEATWIDSSELSKQLAGKKDSDLAVIENFEIGIYEAYALPFLTKCIDREFKVKMILQSGDYSENLPSYELLKIAPVFTIQQSDRLLTYKMALRNSNLQPSNQKMTACRLRKNVNPVKDFSGTVCTFGKTVGLDFPPKLVETASEFAAHLNFYFDEKDAVTVAIEIILMPYALGKFGREMCINFTRSINIQLENRLAIA